MSVALNLSNLCEEKIVVEKAKEFEGSIFRPIYQRTKILLENIISHDRDDHPFNGSKPVISFVGRRGTGKTSAMMSVHNALKNREELEAFISGQIIRESSFVVLDYIDVSTMEKGEDILEIVLAKMYELFLRRERKQQSPGSDISYEIRELYRMFDEVYGILMDIKDMRGHKSDVSPLSLLTQLSNSQILKEKIGGLIEQYLLYMEEGDTRRRKTEEKRFLVITIDDLDMSFQNETEFPFGILETLHRYLMTEGVIILVAYNFSDLCLGCEKHFIKIYSDRKEGLDPHEEDMVKHLTDEYLKKVLPMYNRVHMPSLKKRDYVDDLWPHIKIQPDEIEDVFKGFKKVDPKAASEPWTLDIKKFVMWLRASIAGLYYDAGGVKKHFVEPSQLRGLAQTYAFYMQLKGLKNNDGNEDAIFKALLDNLYFDFAKANLNGDDQEQFESFLNVPLDRRCKDIFTALQAKAEENGSAVQMSCISYRSNAKESYSYGELIYRLYIASKNGWFTKQLIWCILDSYTIMLTKYYRQLKNTENSKEKERCRQQILAVLGTSVASSWSNLLIPKISKTDGANEVIARNRMEYRVYDREDKMQRFAAIKFNGDLIQWDYELADGIEDPDFVIQLQLLEFFAMFFTKVHYRAENASVHDGFNIQYSGVRKWLLDQLVQSDDLDQRRFLRFNITDGCFNIFNFVNNLLDSENFFGQLHEDLKEGFKSYFESIKKTDETVEEFFETNSLKSIYREWFCETQGFALPVYSFDMMYNLFKRQYQNKGLAPESIYINDCWSYIKKCFEDFGELLKTEDQFYFSSPKDESIAPDDMCFFNAYDRSPFIQMIHRLDGDKELEKKFVSQFKNMLGTIVW